MTRRLATWTIRALAIALVALPADAREPAWPELREMLYDDQFLTDAGALITIHAPYRSTEDARTQIGANVAAPEGRLLDSVTVILDENPMPVSAVFTFAQPLPRFFFDLTMRVNGPTPLHVVARTTEGQLFVAESFVKTSGQGACAAPPGTDPELALATLGDMAIAISEIEEVARLLPTAPGRAQSTAYSHDRRMDLDISHPSHSGMQMDQISLLFIPSRYVETVEVDLDGAGYVDVTGSISLSENPRLSLSVPGYTQSVDITMTDTDGTVSTARKTVSGF
ncbi:quinoprotein dehydrogenase-associated SoxYZ-like carrier [Sulfitobacter sp. D35]|uniref:quinoprotein dehydrogenase-associated SoxYZ-like carrier n=1 Tax=Sulfitobacter sp. D35 TaxID=3083252 RepID=UPI0029700536|nr:quinoprotein dehydrogenase-associated SoxYZ-like carrier [Sulfitobacter sp. D35]MDW4498628.1 quinoprotein dehydrogenase-associated SoxYZ-like carrier [Sulfitobacter sp. D35]